MTAQGKVHLVGAMLFASAQDTMVAIGKTLPDEVTWVPDGETGERIMWLTQHQSRFAATPGLKVKPYTAPGTKFVSDRTYYGLVDGATPQDVDLPTLGYAEWARESFEIFAGLQSDGTINANARFMQAIPTPWAFLWSFIHPDDQQALEPVIAQAITNDVRDMCAQIPHEKLAIQWDVAIEFGILEGFFPHSLDDAFAHIVKSLIEIGNNVPADVEMAYHLCYGAPYDIHMVEPADSELMTRVSNAVLDGVGRPVERLHLPVPIERDDRAFFAPLAELELPAETELFLGLVHHEDGVEGGRRRVAAAELFVSGFGVATECGTARTPVDPVELLRLQAAVAQESTGQLDIDVPDIQHVSPPDPAQANAAVREFAEQIACPVCDAASGDPCLGPDEAPLPRPHYPRYTGALAEKVMPPSTA